MEYPSKYQWDKETATHKIHSKLQTHYLNSKMIHIFLLKRKKFLASLILDRGTTTVLTRNPPYHLKDAVDFEPLYPP